MKRWLCIFFGLIFPLGVSAATLHAILVCDTLAENIERASYADLYNMREESNRIAMYTDMELHEISITGEELMPEHLLHQIKDLKINKDDAILFYFSGHGYRTPLKEDSPWPNLFFSAAKEGVAFETIMKKVRKKKARFSVVIADCCNNSIPDAWAPPLFASFTVPKDQLQKIKQGYRSLFSDQKGCIFITSSKAGEYSWCMLKGAVYTLALLEAIHGETVNGYKAGWETILEKAADEVMRYQHPYWEITRAAPYESSPDD